MGVCHGEYSLCLRESCSSSSADHPRRYCPKPGMCGCSQSPAVGAGCPGAGAPVGDAHTSVSLQDAPSPGVCPCAPALEPGGLSCWEAELGVPGLALPCSCGLCRDQLCLCAPQVELQLLLSLADADREAENSQGWFLFGAGRKLWSEGFTSPCTEHGFNSTLTASPGVPSPVLCCGVAGSAAGAVCSQCSPCSARSK